MFQFLNVLFWAKEENFSFLPEFVQLYSFKISKWEKDSAEILVKTSTTKYVEENFTFMFCFPIESRIRFELLNIISLLRVLMEF